MTKELKEIFEKWLMSGDLRPFEEYAREQTTNQFNSFPEISENQSQGGFDFSSGATSPISFTSMDPFSNYPNLNSTRQRPPVEQPPQLNYTGLPESLQGAPNLTMEDVQLPNMDIPFPNQEQPDFWETLANNPAFGTSLDTADKFRLAGASFAYNPEFMDAPGQKRAKRMGNITGTAALASGTMDAVKSFMSGRGTMKRTQESFTDFMNRSRRGQQPQPRYFEEGGVMDLPYEKLMVDDFITGLPKSLEDRHNAEVEGKEFIIGAQDGSLKEVLGKKHSKGGEKVVLQDGDAVISNKLKVGDDAKLLVEATGIKITKNDSYAAVIKKFEKAIGYEELRNDIEKLYKKMEETSNLKDNKTKELNSEFLRKEIQRKEQEREQLNQLRKSFAGDIFDTQEMRKQTTPKFEMGGTFQSPKFMALASKYGMSPEEAYYLLESSGAFMQAGGTFRMNTPGEAVPIEFTIDDEEDFSTVQNLLEIIGEKGVRKDSKKYRDAIKELVSIGEKYEKGTEMSQYLAGVKEGKSTPVTSQMFKNRHINTEYTLESPQSSMEPVVPTEPEIDPQTGEFIQFDPLTGQRVKSSSNLFIPGTSNLPPTGMLPHAKTTFRGEQLSPVGISPDQNIRELNKMSSASREVIDGLPIGLRTAANAALTSNLMEETNKAVTASEAYNAQARMTADQFNIQQGTLEEQFRVREIPRYEELQLTALDKTLTDINNYFNTQHRNRMAKYNYMSQARIIDSMFPNVTFDPFGTPSVDTESIPDFMAPRTN